MVHCHTKMELFVPVFSTLGIYRAAATDVPINEGQTLMSKDLHTVQDLTQTCSLPELQRPLAGLVYSNAVQFKQMEQK